MKRNSLPSDGFHFIFRLDLLVMCSKREWVIVSILQNTSTSEWCMRIVVACNVKQCDNMQHIAKVLVSVKI